MFRLAFRSVIKKEKKRKNKLQMLIFNARFELLTNF